MRPTSLQYAVNEEPSAEAGQYHTKINLLVFLVNYFGLPAFMFISGGFLGDVAKLRVFDPDKFMSGWAVRLADLISSVRGTASSEPQSTEPQRRKRLVILIRGLGAVFRSLTVTSILVYIGHAANLIEIFTFLANLLANLIGIKPP